MRTNRSRVLTWQAIIVAGLLSVGASLAYSGDAAADEWKAPARAAKKPNPIAADTVSVAAGKKIFAGNCLACHGPLGKGDGPAAAAITPKPRDLSDPAIQSQTDGSMFWKLTEGKKPMPSFEKLIGEDDRWNVINYVRTLAAKKGTP
jgi:mono/diheme cytochrome c family protein